jgi:hypothetical protein
MPTACLANHILPKSITLWIQAKNLNYEYLLCVISSSFSLLYQKFFERGVFNLVGFVEASIICSQNTHTVSVYPLRHLHQGRNELLQFANRSSRPLRAELPLLSNLPHSSCFLHGLLAILFLLTSSVFVTAFPESFQSLWKCSHPDTQYITTHACQHSLRDR